MQFTQSSDGTKHIYKSVTQWLARNSSKINIFNKAKMDYEKVLKQRYIQQTKLHTKQRQQPKNEK